jgi:hypothetical protein
MSETHNLRDEYRVRAARLRDVTAWIADDHARRILLLNAAEYERSADSLERFGLVRAPGSGAWGESDGERKLIARN